MAGSTETDRESFVEAAEKFWHENGANMTVVRRVICNAIGGNDEAFDAETLLAWAKRGDPLISLSSVYRTLSALEEAELVIEIEGRDGKKLHRKSLGRDTASSHIVCRDCGVVIPVDDPCLSLRESTAAREKGFHAEKITLRMEASCDELERTGKCGNCRTGDGKQAGVRNRSSDSA